ncbi:glycosyltransferase family 4 protein [Microbacterium invictum]|uniref:D-inositol 3-phosphate glycosyltransferase n=1 Tax=Microbacterium invictum TaxID=515415 RepID=A0ABZ0VD51_9MICO|nr:glycosyltransferase family 4 protein [Microbacterium invictum]WQB69742.1 glycosyltransferase family 4 protein [Microbacterium invictum]
MRIAHLDLTASASPVDGIGAVIATLARAQRAGGGEGARAGGTDEVDVLGPRWRAGASLPATAVRLVRALARGRYDVVHLHSVYRPLHALAAAVCVLSGTPYAVSPHSGLSPIGRRRARVRKAVWIAVVERAVLRRATAVVCLSAQERGDVRALVPSARCAIVRNPLEPRAAVPRDPATPPVAVTLARFDVYQKGLDRLAALAAAAPEIRFDVHGDLDANDPGAARRLMATAPENLRFLPPVRGADKDAALAASALYLQLSRWEGQSIALLEALAAGVPCVVSAAVAESLAPDGGHTVVTVPDDPDAAARRIRALLADPAERARLSREGAAWVRDTTDPARIAAQLRAVYRSGTPSPLRRATFQEVS